MKQTTVMAKKNKNSDKKQGDIHDSARDQERLAPDEGRIDLPDVKDIPGQEHVHVPRLGELADDTISSDDEEGRGIFNDDPGEETMIRGNEGDVSADEKVALERTENIQDTRDDNDLRGTTLDTADREGVKLNESFDRTGEDLDVPGAEEDDRQEDIGEEDEENNSYSLGQDPG
jgi:hypothetical protein